MREWTAEMKRAGQIAVISFTEQGFLLALRIEEALQKQGDVRLYTPKEEVARQHPQAILVRKSLKDWCAEAFRSSSALVFVGACGIAVRTIAPFLASKTSDPAVLVADERGKHVISLLSGHLGGANELTRQLAAAIGADPVITTASDVNGRLAIDVWAAQNHLVITDMHMAKRAAAAIAAGRTVPMYCEGKIEGIVPKELHCVEMAMPQKTHGVETAAECDMHCAETEMEQDTPGEPEFLIQISVAQPKAAPCLHLVPRSVILGIGCRRGKPFEEIYREVSAILEKERISPESIYKIASIDLKSEEEGILALAKYWEVPFETFSADMLMHVPGTYDASDFVQKVTGADNICERAAMAALPFEEQKTARFLMPKTKGSGVTVALLEREWSVSFE